MAGGPAVVNMQPVPVPPDLDPGSTAVISTWNKRSDVRENLLAVRAQEVPFTAVVVVDNASHDGTADMIRGEFPEVTLIACEHSEAGACETFNMGFRASRTEFTAILDDDIVLPPDWNRRLLARFAEEPDTTGLLSTRILEPGMPLEYRESEALNTERYMGTFRGCGTLARTEVLFRAGLYDEVFFIYGNERDLSARVMNLGYRIKQVPEVTTWHKTPFGIKQGERSLYYHARNFLLWAMKYAPAAELAAAPFRLVGSLFGAAATDATGTIGVGRSLTETPGAAWILVRAVGSALRTLPHCLRHRQPCRHPDFEMPWK